MNRRILLIDADPAFRASLEQQLARYRFDIAAEPDAEQALAQGAAQPPALLMVAVEEPDKAGFKVFQRCRKGALAKVPIVLVTASVSPESFAKHRSLKVHADGYLDRRSLSDADLLAAIDAAVGLGEPADPNKPAASDVVPLASDDMVLEETVGEDDAEASGGDHRVDSMVDAETDAAFAALVGEDQPGAPDGDAASAEAPAEAPPAEEPATRDEPSVVSAVPAAIHDGNRPQDSGGIDFDSFSRESMRPPVELIARVRRDHRESAPPEEPPDERPDERPHDGPGPSEELPDESASAIPIDVDDLEQVEDEVASPSPPIPPAPPALRPPSAPRPPSEPRPRSESRPPSEPGGGKPRFVDASTLVESRPHATASVPPPVAHSAAAVPDLGLDQIAATEATTDSGVFDRRALRKLGELERQIAQLKTELDRARAAADASARGSHREREFVNLREQITAKDKDLQRTKDELRVRDRELADAQDRLRTSEHARGALDARLGELEHRATADANRAAALEMRDKANANQVAALQQDLEARTAAANAVEAARVHIERELAAERALRAAHASDAERSLRLEREQLIARHHAELSGMRAEAATAREAALHALRNELDAEHAAAAAAAVAAARGEVAAQVERRTGQLQTAHVAELTRQRDDQLAVIAELTEQRDAALAQVASERESAVAAIDDEHHQVIARLQTERAAELAQAREDAAAQLAQLGEEAAADLAHVKQEAESRIAAIITARDRAVAELVAELERTRHGLAAAQNEHEEALGAAAADQAAALDEQARHHADELARRDRDHAAARARDAADRDAAVAAVKAELDHQAAQHCSKLDAVHAEIDELLEQHEQLKGELVEQHRVAVEELAQAHAAELARAEHDHQRAVADLQRAAVEARAAGERVATQLRTEIEQRNELAAREAAEHRTALLAVKRALDEAAARHHAEREAQERSAAKALEDQKAHHERALAIAHGEVLKTKAVADADHGKTIAALNAEHERQRKDAAAEHARIAGELTSERDELRRGLSSARDGLKRNEAELATAVQTIADRNAELRAHAGAIAERDQRITELRHEIETLEHENASYQEQVLRAYQKIKADEAMVARAKKAMAIALTVLDDQGNPKVEPT